MTEKQIEELIEQLETARTAVVKLEKIFDACEAANAKHLAHINQLEQLCRDLYMRICYYNETHDRLQFDDRMEQLGLLHETEYDPDTGLKWGEQQ